MQRATDQHRFVGLAALGALGVLALGARAAHAAPPVINSFSPESHIQNVVPQPTFTITGSNFVVGLPSPTNRPTVTLTHESGKFQYSTLGNTNFSGTQITVPGGINEFNLLQAPLGVYDLTVARPDGESATLPGAFSIMTEDQAAGNNVNIKHVASWGGPVQDVDVVGDLAYIAHGRCLSIVNIADPANPVRMGWIDLQGVASVRVRDGYAFVAAVRPYRFCVVDVSNPADPKLVWHAYGTAGNENSPDNVMLYGNWAYVRGNSRKIQLFDVTDPRNVINLGYVIGDVVASDLVGHHLFVGTRGTSDSPPQLRIYDLAANPVNPPLVGMISAPINTGAANTTLSLSVDGSLVAWLVEPEDLTVEPVRFYMVDVSNPSAPTIVSSHDSLYKPVDVAVSDGFVYVASESLHHVWTAGLGMAVFNVADPANPALVTNYKPHGSVFGLRVIGDRAYLFDEGEGLIIMDVSNPAKPVRLGNYHSPSTLRKIAKNGDLLYVADAWNGFTILDISNPADPEVLGVYLVEHLDGLGVDAFGIAYQDNKVYLTAAKLGLEVVDVSNPASPSFLGAFRIPNDGFNAACSEFRGIALSGHVAHIGWKRGPNFCPPVGCYCPCEVCGPCADPVYDSSGGCWCPCPCEPEYYDVQSTTRFLNLDISNPANIFPLGVAVVCEKSHTPRTIVVNPQGIAFVGRNGTKMTFDTSDPQNPWVMLWDDVNPAADLALEGDTLFIANNKHDLNLPDPQAGLYIQDVSDPADPLLLTHINENDPLASGTEFAEAYAVAVQNQRLYVSSLLGVDGFGVVVFDVSNPVSPVYLDRSGGSIGESSLFDKDSSTLLVDEPYVYSATSEPSTSVGLPEGLVILEVQNLPPAGMPGDITGDGVVNVSDLLAVISAWGPCPTPPASCAADVASSGGAGGDGVVNVNDLLYVINHWG